MKWFGISILCLIFLLACAEELPPSPPPPGGETVAGRAIGGLTIAQGTLPKWAAQLKYTDVSPVSVQPGATVEVTVEGDPAFKDKMFIYAIAYAFNKKFNLWEKALADTGRSGKITKDWAKGKAVFSIPASTERFTPGPNYVVIYWCIDTGNRDDQGYKIWDCNGKKWGLGAFEFIGERWPDFLIEKDIENNRYKSSSKGTPPSDAFTGATKSAGTMGESYTASYTDLNNVKTDVIVIRLTDVTKFKRDLANQFTTLQPKWTENVGGTACGFMFTGSGQVSFSWLNNYYWVTTKTYANTLNYELVGNYQKKTSEKYQSDCTLKDALRTIAGVTATPTPTPVTVGPTPTPTPTPVAGPAVTPTPIPSPIAGISLTNCAGTATAFRWAETNCVSTAPAQTTVKIKSCPGGLPLATPTPTPTPIVTSTPTPTPTPAVSPTPTPTPVSSPTPTPTPGANVVAGIYGRAWYPDKTTAASFVESDVISSNTAQFALMLIATIGILLITLLNFIEPRDRFK